MKRHLYRERDYAFGLLIQTLRTTIGLSQAGLGELLAPASCGNDGAIRLWDLGSSEPQRVQRYRLYERLDITGIRGLTEAQKASLRALGAVEKREGLPKE